MVLTCCSFSNLTFPPRHVSISVEPPCLDGHFFEWPRSDVELYVEPVNDGSSSRPGQFLDNFAEVMLNFNNRHSLKLRLRLRSTHYNNRMRCLINSWPAFATIDSTTIASTTDTFITVQVPVHPEPPSPKAQPTVPSPTPLPFNSDEMLQKMRMNVQADLGEALKK